jgi:hypothetical protein
MPGYAIATFEAQSLLNSESAGGTAGEDYSRVVRIGRTLNKIGAAELGKSFSSMHLF